MSTKMTTEKFISKAQEIHGDKYDYSLTEYITQSTNVKIICKEHGEFEQNPSNHIHNKQGCMICGRNRTIVARSFTTEIFIKKAKELNGDRYDYSLVEYKNYTTKVKIICKEHGEFTQTPSGHLQGFHCKRCAINENNKMTAVEMYKDKPTTLYYIKMGNYYKLGLTRRSIHERFQCEKSNYEIVDSWEFNDGIDAWKIEQSVLAETYEYAVSVDESPIKKGGYTEVRSTDIINTIRKYVNCK